MKTTLRSRFCDAALVLFGICGVAGSALAEEATVARNSPAYSSPPTIEQNALGRRGDFYVGGAYEGEQDKEVMRGAMFVDVLVPKEVRQPYPLVLFHGAGQTAVNWLGTPDGRKGWADAFVEQGFVVYLVDQPARGRSAYHPELDGKLKSFTAPAAEKFFTAIGSLGSWPQAKFHTQWPGAGTMGDPVFDDFYRTQVDYLASNAETQELVVAAGTALLDRIGPAVLLTHSQAGTFGWLLADRRPELVKGILALEPNGPPFEEAVLSTGKARPYGPTDIALTYDPPIASPGDLDVVQQDKPDAPDLSKCWLQHPPARKLPHLADIPILVATTEASYHAVYDHCTAKFLTQAGAQVDFVRLADHGLRGNGHMMMLEKNSLDIAAFLGRWASDHIGRK